MSSRALKLSEESIRSSPMALVFLDFSEFHGSRALKMSEESIRSSPMALVFLDFSEFYGTRNRDPS
jgi:hypothetical protein